MMCPHCMEDSTPDSGEFITMDIFRKAVYFGLDVGCKVFILSGGEPTEHDQLLRLCQWLDNTLRGRMSLFSICTNGMWLKDQQKCEQMKKITRLSTFKGMQIYTHKRWYREYDYVIKHKMDYERFPHTLVEVDSPIYMQDLGRARSCEEAQKEVAKNPYFMSCCNCALAARQLEMRDFGVTLTIRRQFCKPSVDAQGYVHMSESRLCPTVGSVNKDKSEDIYERMRSFVPCGRCANCVRFKESEDLKIQQAKHLLFG